MKQKGNQSSVLNELKVGGDKKTDSGMHAVRTEIAGLRLAVEQLAKSSTSGTDKTKHTFSRLCQRCQDEGNRNCIHCWECGSEEHFSRGCRKTVVKSADQGNSNRSHQGGKM